MIEIKVGPDGCHYSVHGQTLDLLAEIPIAIGPVMRKVFRDCPAAIKDDLIKDVFECILMEMQGVEE